MYFVYVIKSLKDKTTYIGFTENLQKRLKEHNNGKTKSIKHKIPFKLVYFEEYQSKTLARKREIKLKKNNSEKEKLYKEIFNETTNDTLIKKIEAQISQKFKRGSLTVTEKHLNKIFSLLNEMSSVEKDKLVFFLPPINVSFKEDYIYFSGPFSFINSL